MLFLEYYYIDQLASSATAAVYGRVFAVHFPFFSRAQVFSLPLCLSWGQTGVYSCQLHSSLALSISLISLFPTRSLGLFFLCDETFLWDQNTPCLCSNQEATGLRFQNEERPKGLWAHMPEPQWCRHLCPRISMQEGTGEGHLGSSVGHTDNRLGIHEGHFLLQLRSDCGELW